MATNWRFFQAISAKGKGVVDEWLENASVRAEIKFMERSRHLMQMPHGSWVENWAKKLHGNCDGLVEIRFKVDGVQQRPLGFFGPGKGEFTILLMATERNNRFVPKNACSTALRIRDDILAETCRYGPVEIE